MRLSSRRPDDADVIRARLRALLDEGHRAEGWVPADDLDEEGPASRAPDLPDDKEEVALPSGLGRHRAPESAVRLDPGRRGVRSLWIAGLLAALLLAGWTWLDRPRVEPVDSTGSDAVSSAPVSPAVGEAAETSTAVVVSVVGLVARPGLVTLPSGSRVADAVEAAGGLLPDADATSVNLAAVVSDGQQIAVGVPGAAAPPDRCGARDGGRTGEPQLRHGRGSGRVAGDRPRAGTTDHRLPRRAGALHHGRAARRRAGYRPWPSTTG